MDYNEIQVLSGRDIAARREETLQPVPTAEGLLAAEQARAVAEVQAALVIAAGRPRNELRARDNLMKACQRIGLASSAVYNYPRGGQSVSGPSIRLAEIAARAWGNMTYGFRELSRRKGESDCEAFAWDLETNTKAIRQFSVRHWRDTKQGGYQLKDERDIYELLANQAQRRVRAAILEIIPGDIIEDAVAECERTMKAKLGGDIAVATKNLVEAFGKLGVTREQLEKRLGHRLDAIQPAQIINFRRIYTSIKDGMSAASEWFDADTASPVLPAKAAPKADTAKNETKGAGEKENNEVKRNGNGKVQKQLRERLVALCGDDTRKQQTLFDAANGGSGRHTIDEIEGLTDSEALYQLTRIEQMQTETTPAEEQ